MADARLRRPSLAAGLVGVAVLLVAGGSLLRITAPDPERTPAGGEAEALRRVVTLRIASVPIRPLVEVAGVLEARRSVALFSETRGPVTAVGAEALDSVAAGQTLVEIDPLLAEVAVERARAAVARTESELSLARSNLERRRNLADRGVASPADLDDAVNAEKVTAAALRESRADLVRARDELTKKSIAAPFAGVLRSFEVEEGEYLQDGQKLGELLDLGTARATIGLADSDVVAVRAGQPVEVSVDALPNERFQGVVLRVGAASDPQTRKFPVEVEVPNPDGRLRPGMVASVAIDLGEPVPSIVVPREATLDEFGLRFVWVIEQDGEGPAVARRRRIAVRPIPFRPGIFEVVSGLAEGEVIALSATRELRDGERVVPEASRAS